MLMFPSALVALLLIASVQAETNVTIDDMDPRIVYQPPVEWSFQGNTAATSDRLNSTTHYTAVLGATASLTFTGAVYVHFVGYAMKDLASPALIPITLQPWHGSAITVQSDAHRPPAAQAQTIIFTSNRLDPTETYTITITKTNATSDVHLNIDSFILTQPDGVDSPLPPPAPTVVIGGATLTGPVVSLWVTGTTSISDSDFPQYSSITNADGSNHFNGGAIVGAIVGGVIGGIAIGIIIAFLAFRWWSKRYQQIRSFAGSDVVPNSFFAPRTAYFSATSEHSGTSPQTTIPVVPDYHSDPFGVSLPLTPANTVSVQSTVNGRTEMAQVQRTVPPIPRLQTKTQFTGTSRPNNLISAPQPPAHVVPPLQEDSEYGEAILPAYS